jgi:hypothetical protein
MEQRSSRAKSSSIQFSPAFGPFNNATARLLASHRNAIELSEVLIIQPFHQIIEDMARPDEDVALPAGNNTSM